ncbi:hypothetical protein C8R44DRAFT_879447 [Mycena epipterygia]|nr:hypothetical protein C8R44DRAFT_879447 [Mycena epipterygia]
MAPKPWATDQERSWLLLQMADYVLRRAQGKLHLFWGQMQEGWFHTFPEHDKLGFPRPSDESAAPLTAEQLAALGAAIVKRKEQLTNWFRREEYKIRTVPKDKRKGAAGLARALSARPSKPRGRAHQAKEIYQKEHKEEIAERGFPSLNEAARTQLNEEGVEETLEEQEVVSELWANASQEERDKAQAQVEREKEAKKNKELEDEQNEGKKAPEEYQEGIDGLRSLFKEAHKLGHESSGWVGFTMLGGPTPRQQGELTLKVICLGETPAGNDFESSCTDFEGTLVKAFDLFLNRVYSRGTRATTRRSGASDCACTDGHRSKACCETKEAQADWAHSGGVYIYLDFCISLWVAVAYICVFFTRVRHSSSSPPVPAVAPTSWLALCATTPQDSQLFLDDLGASLDATFGPGCDVDPIADPTVAWLAGPDEMDIFGIGDSSGVEDWAWPTQEETWAQTVGAGASGSAVGVAPLASPAAPVAPAVSLAAVVRPTARPCFKGAAFPNNHIEDGADEGGFVFPPKSTNLIATPQTSGGGRGAYPRSTLFEAFSGRPPSQSSPITQSQSQSPITPDGTPASLRRKTWLSPPRKIAFPSRTREAMASILAIATARL